MSLDKKDGEIIQEIIEKVVRSSEDRLRSEMGSMEERLLVEIAASEGRMRREIENLAGMTHREFEQMGKRISEVSDRLQLVERRIAQLEAAVFSK